MAPLVLSVDTNLWWDILTSSLGLKWWWWRCTWQFVSANIVLAVGHSRNIKPYDLYHTQCGSYSVVSCHSSPSFSSCLHRSDYSYSASMVGPIDIITCNSDKLSFWAMAHSMFLHTCGPHVPDCMMSQAVTPQQPSLWQLQNLCHYQWWQGVTQMQRPLVSWHSYQVP